MTILKAILLGLLGREIGQWCPWVAEQLIRHSLRRFPDEARDRLEEEWQYIIEETPGFFSKLVRAVCLTMGARTISRQEWVKELKRRESAEPRIVKATGPVETEDVDQVVFEVPMEDRPYLEQVAARRLEIFQSRANSEETNVTEEELLGEFRAPGYTMNLEE